MHEQPDEACVTYQREIFQALAMGRRHFGGTDPLVVLIAVGSDDTVIMALPRTVVREVKGDKYIEWAAAQLDRPLAPGMFYVIVARPPEVSVTRMMGFMTAQGGVA
jgi:hypothetical protein